jgi:nicotinate-nucleotide adenylyltransferase
MADAKIKTGLFFGSFNPIHVGHLIIGSHLAHYTDLKQVWFVVTPQNPLKDKKDLLKQNLRLEMVQLATEDDPRLKTCDIEFHLPKPSYTINTLLHLEEKYPDREWVLIMGADTIPTLPKWKNFETLINNYEIYVYPRPYYEINEAELTPMIKLIKDVPIMEISASYIRRAIKERTNARFFLPDKVFNFIDKWGLYLK